MSEQRFIRFEAAEADLDAVAAATDATAGSTVRVDDGVATVGFRGRLPKIAYSLARMEAPSGGKIWSLREVLEALPVVAEP